MENLSREIETVKGKQMEILKLKSAITEIKNSLYVLNSRLKMKEQQLEDFGNKSIEMIQSAERG